MGDRSRKKKYKAKQKEIHHGRRETHSNRLTADELCATTGPEAPADSRGHFPPPQDRGKAHLGTTAGYGSNSCWVPAKPHFNSLFFCRELATFTVSIIKKKVEKLFSCKHIHCIRPTLDYKHKKGEGAFRLSEYRYIYLITHLSNI